MLDAYGEMLYIQGHKVYTHVYPMSLCAPHFHGTDGQCACASTRFYLVWISQFHEKSVTSIFWQEFQVITVILST